jgi:hypothetical protein
MRSLKTSTKMEFKPKEFLDKWVKENYPEENISEEEFDNADMLMFAHAYYQHKLKLLGIANVSARTLGINSCAALIKSMPTDQAIQVMKSDITGQPQTTIIDGQLVVAYVR